MYILPGHDHSRGVVREGEYPAPLLAPELLGADPYLKQKGMKTALSFPTIEYLYLYNSWDEKIK